MTLYLFLIDKVAASSVDGKRRGG